MNKKYLFFTLILSNFCNHYSFTMDNQAPMDDQDTSKSSTGKDEKRAALYHLRSAMLYQSSSEDDEKRAALYHLIRSAMLYQSSSEDDEECTAHDQFGNAITDNDLFIDNQDTSKSSTKDDEECDANGQFANAMGKDDLDTVRYLIDNLAISKSSTKDDEKCDANKQFWEAMQRDDLDTVRYFIENKRIDKNFMNFGTHENLLHLAVSYNSFKVVKYLIATDANINTTPNPLKMAMENRMNIDIKIVQLLIEKGADLKFIEPGTKKTFLHYAVDTHYTIDQLKKAKIKYFLEQLFIRLGPDEALKIIQAKDIDNKTAADAALKWEHKKIYPLLEKFGVKATATEEKTKIT